ncbi:MAG: hypothetical protein ACSLE0_16780 [Chitinophagaceae bacterium]
MMPGIKTVIFLFLFCQKVSLPAQEKVWPDSTIELKYQLDSIVPVDAPVDSAVAEDYSDEEEEDEKTEQEYFLRKEFTGGLPDTLSFRRLGDSVKKAMRRDDAFWYANEVFKKTEKKKNGSGVLAHPVFQSILWLIIIGGFITVLVLYLANSHTGLFRKSKSLAAEDEDAALDDIFQINYPQEIEKATSIKNYRLAVRLLFLQLLRNLANRQIIQYRQDGTNQDYMMQLNSTRLYPAFFKLARNYEYCWYGQFEIDKEKYAVIKKDFEIFERGL